MEYFQKRIDYENEIELEKERAKLTENFVSLRDLKERKVAVNNKLLTLDYDLGKKIDSASLSHVDSQLFEQIGFFDDRDAEYQKEPAFVASIILPLATYVESFMKLVKFEEEKTGTSSFPPKVACKLADTIKDYFIPTLFERLDQIDVQTDQHRFVKEGKYANMHETLKEPFNPNKKWDNIQRSLRCSRHQGDRAAFDRESKNLFPPLKFQSTTFFGYRTFKLNMDKTNVTLIKDNLGDKNDYFVGETKDCASDYFSLVRHRLEEEFATAYKKVQQFCTLKRKEKAGNYDTI